MKTLRARLAMLLTCALTMISVPLWSQIVEVRDDSLFVDGKRQPQLWGAELQYFRLRGGYGPNVPRSKVIELWNKALDRMVEAKMNTISFYIPWDFHEYAEGKFDFTGTVDQDGDGNADYPSRDIHTFFQLVEAHGIKRIMARPGPYINAEWGFLGFGAIPYWFHLKYPDSHMRNAQGLRTKLYDYHNPDLLKHTQKWFEVLYRDVLSAYMGPGKPILFMQIDNETNFMWQSLFNHDYSASAINRYHEFLKQRYPSITALNDAQRTQVKEFSEVKAPTIPGANISQDQDWYRFQDQSIYEYLVLIRQMWEQLGVKEPQILFTLAESYDHTANGQLVNFKQRNMPGKTGMITMNMYPKKYEAPNGAFINIPFKIDHDVKVMDSANDYYLGNASQWLMGPEIQGGWWRGIDVSPEARQQTYLSALGHGLKAMLIYYFSEGDNWQVEWAFEQVNPRYEKLKSIKGLDRIRKEDLPQAFWLELQGLVEKEVIFGIDVRHIMFEDLSIAKKLFFDAPLDGDANPSRHFELIKTLGQNVIAPFDDYYATSLNLNEGVVVLKDVNNHPPSHSASAGVSNLMLNADWSAGLVGYLMQVGLNPTVKIFELNPNEELKRAPAIFYQDPADTALVTDEMTSFVKDYVQGGGVFISMIGTTLAEHLGLSVMSEPSMVKNSSVSVTGLINGQSLALNVPSQPLFKSAIATECDAILLIDSDIAGFKCPYGKGWFIQVSALLHGQYNSDDYSDLNQGSEKNAFLRSLLKTANVNPYWELPADSDRVVVFSRYSPQYQGTLLTVKSGHKTPTDTGVKATEEGLKRLKLEVAGEFYIKNLLTGADDVMSREEFLTKGFSVKLKALGSAVFYITAL